ncbi:hypothetical protein [Streptomyces sp. NPDC051219]|uniref:hypothetical protein n=1 Tax=Streptomyces sp. NPDC051219 TaxID=3155283 RepID=UPI003421B177
MNIAYAQLLAQIKQGSPQFDVIDTSRADVVRCKDEDATGELDYDRLKEAKNAGIAESHAWRLPGTMPAIGVPVVEGAEGVCDAGVAGTRRNTSTPTTADRHHLPPPRSPSGTTGGGHHHVTTRPPVPVPFSLPRSRRSSRSTAKSWRTWSFYRTACRA